MKMPQVKKNQKEKKKEKKQDEETTTAVMSAIKKSDEPQQPVPVVVSQSRDREKDVFLFEVGRIITGGYYDYQDVRKGAMNRIRDVLRKLNEGIDLTKPEPKRGDTEEEKAKRFSKEYVDENIPALLEGMMKEGKLNIDEYEYAKSCLDTFDNAKSFENSFKKQMEAFVNTQSVWTEWLGRPNLKTQMPEGVKGIGPVITANLLKEIQYCERFETVSRLWKYSGLSVNEEGKAIRKVKGQKIAYNPKLKVLAWKIADLFIKHRTSPYREHYDAEKQKQVLLLEGGEKELKLLEEKIRQKIEEGRAEKGEMPRYQLPTLPASKMHAELRARRKMAKLFLSHYWMVTRTLKGLPTTFEQEQDSEGKEEKPRIYAFSSMQHNLKRGFIPPPFWSEIITKTKQQTDVRARAR